MQHPSLIERSVGATLRAFSKGQVTFEEAELDLVELIANQMIGKTDYAVAVVAYYVRAVLQSLARHKITIVEAFETIVDSAIGASDGGEAVSSRLAQPFFKMRTGDSGQDRGAHP